MIRRLVTGDPPVAAGVSHEGAGGERPPTAADRDHRGVRPQEAGARTAYGKERTATAATSVGPGDMLEDITIH